MTVVSERLGTVEHEGPLPVITRGLVENEPRYRELVGQFGDRALEAVEYYAAQREQAGMGPQNPNVSHAYWDKKLTKGKRSAS